MLIISKGFSQWAAGKGRIRSGLIFFFSRLIVTLVSVEASLCAKRKGDMKKLIPYKTVRGALAALDNGGRFFNLFSRPSDGVISRGELSKATGQLLNIKQSSLFFAMMLDRLPEADRETVIARLAASLRRKVRRNYPKRIGPEALAAHKKEKGPLIVEGVPLYCRSQNQFTSFITIPVQADSVTTQMMIPIYEEFSMYYLESETKVPVPIAVPKKVTRLPERSMKFGGFVQPASSSKEKPDSSDCYFTPVFYLP